MSREVLRREVLWRYVGGLKTYAIAEELKLPAAAIAAALEEAFAELRAENAWLAKNALDVRLARFDRLIEKVMPDLESEKQAVRLAAVREVRAIETDRQRLLLGAKQCEAIDRDLRRAGDDENTPRTRISFVREDRVRRGHEVRRDDDDDVDDEVTA